MKQMLRRRRYGNTLNYYNNHNIRLLQKYSSTLEKEEYEIYIVFKLVKTVNV